MTNDELLAELAVGESMEIAPGVKVERRCFLQTAALAAGAIALPSTPHFRPDPRSRNPPSDGRIEYEKFLATVGPEVKKRIAAIPKTGEDHYLHWLASHAVRLANVAMPDKARKIELGRFNALLGINEGVDGFVVLHWQLGPGVRIRPHAHTYGNVVTVGLEGEAIIENWEMFGAQDLTPGKEVRLRRTNRQLLRPNGINLVPLSHGYVHGFRAGPKGVRFLDITSRLREKQKTPYLRVDPEPVNATRQEYSGVWYFDS